MIEVLAGKIHRAVVTDSNINYEGSITISKDLLNASELYEFQKVSVVDVENGNRFETYIISTDNPGIICVNGAAARLVSIGDHVIIMAYRMVSRLELDKISPKIIRVNENNQIIQSEHK